MLEPDGNGELPPIPGKRYFTIGEVSGLCDVNPTFYVIGNKNSRNLNQLNAVAIDVTISAKTSLDSTIRALLYEQGFTIGGTPAACSESAKDDVTQFNMLVKQMLSELEDILRALKS
ncbi:MAG: hypothetical protein CM15mP120_10290 [Pseudomonadota bacterium]|nr:MAG: hypothetical protein CM15mP120_10290 [Pseudomonadota bacterium]